jgi:hypothetical protein
MSETAQDWPAMHARMQDQAVRELDVLLAKADTVTEVTAIWEAVQGVYYACEPQTQIKMLRLRGDALERIARDAEL